MNIDHFELDGKFHWLVTPTSIRKDDHQTSVQNIWPYFFFLFSMALGTLILGHIYYFTGKVHLLLEIILFSVSQWIAFKICKAMPRVMVILFYITLLAIVIGFVVFIICMIDAADARR